MADAYLAYNSPEVSDLIVRCQQGDHRAFDELVAKYQRYVFNLVYQHLGDIDEIEDVATAVQALANCTDNTSIAVFSREEEEIEAALDDDFRHITISARTEDVETYIRAEMMLREGNGRLIVKDAAAKEKIESELVGRANGM